MHFFSDSRIEKNYWIILRHQVSYRIAPRLLVKRGRIKSHDYYYISSQSIGGGRDWSRDSWFRANICHWPRGRAVQRAQSRQATHTCTRETRRGREVCRAIRARNTNSPNTINYFPRNILSFCFTSNPHRPFSTFTQLVPTTRLSDLFYVRGRTDTLSREYLCYIYIRRGTFIPPKSIIPVNIAVHVRFAMEITNTWVLVDVCSLDGHCVAARV